MLMYADLAGPTDKGGNGKQNTCTCRTQRTLRFPETSEAFKNCVLDERRRELAGEGIRWYDIVRSGNFTEYIKAAYILEERRNKRCRKRAEGMTCLSHTRQTVIEQATACTQTKHTNNQ